ncbi:MAG: hypothetical protein ACI3XP_04290 [Eubacteriales bacterium]
MKLPKAFLTLTLVFASSLWFTALFLYTAVRRRSMFAAFSAAISFLSSVGIAHVVEDYCRAASFSPRAYFSVNRVIEDFFQSLDPTRAPDIHD